MGYYRQTRSIKVGTVRWTSSGLGPARYYSGAVDGLAFVVDDELAAVVVFVNCPLRPIREMAGSEDAFHSG
jgi:hypothetical protein